VNEYVDRLNQVMLNKIPGGFLETVAIDKPLNTSRTVELDVHGADVNIEHIHASTPGTYSFVKSK